MLKWIILCAIIVLVTIFVIRIIKVMLKVEKDSKKEKKSEETVQNKYVPDQVPINLHSTSGSVSMSDLEQPSSTTHNTSQGDPIYNDFNSSNNTGFTDHADEEFFDYSNHMHSRKGKRRKQIDFDLDGEMADDDFEYIPGGSDFSYLNGRKSSKSRKTTQQSLNELPTDLKVLMLSDIFDRKFFD